MPFGQYEFNRLPFGLSNSPENSQTTLMDTVLKDLIGSELFVFIDDLIVFSISVEEQAIRLEHVLLTLLKANLQLHPGKCLFEEPRLRYRGFELSESRVSACADKVKAVKEYPTTKNVKDVRAFLVP